MLLAQILGPTTQLVNKDVESPVSKFGFVFVSNTATPLTTTYTTLNAFQTAIANMKITLIAQGRDKHKTIFQEFPIGDLIEIAASNEGCVDADSFGIIQSTIELSERGALQLDDDTKLILSVTGKPTTMDVYIWAIDHPNRVTETMVYEIRTVLANNEKEYDVQDYTHIAIPGTLTTIELRYANGNTVRYAPNELALIVKDTNEIVTNWAGQILTGHSNFYVISVEAVTTMKVQFSANAQLYLMKESMLQRPIIGQTPKV